MKKLLLVSLFSLVAGLSATTSSAGLIGDIKKDLDGWCVFGHKHDIPNGACRTNPAQD